MIKFLLELALTVWRSIRKPVGVPVPIPAEPAANADRGFYLDARQIRVVRGLRGAYEAAVKLVGGLPWQALAAIHYRENEFALRSTTPGGPFQLDPGGEGPDLRRRIEAYEDLVRKAYGIDGGSIETDLAFAALVAAHELRGKIRTELTRDEIADGDVLADALWGYNGRAPFHTSTGTADDKDWSWRWSPYVANDPKRGVVLRLRGTIPDASVPGGRRAIDRPDGRPGAFVVYRELIDRGGELA